ncbi:hypothetical protein RhiJN_23325 [Ceratobasidium sp. AG-Ba]|nr:hypothetical protein RhiJN_23325 [Ceratobasidium sp. AG-Ba]
MPARRAGHVRRRCDATPCAALRPSYDSTRRRASLLRTPTSTHYGSNAVASTANTCSSEPTPCSPEPTPAPRSQHLLSGANTCSPEPTPALRSQHPLLGANTCSPEPTPALLEPTPALLEPTPLPGANTRSRQANIVSPSPPRRFGPQFVPRRHTHIDWVRIQFGGRLNAIREHNPA